MTTNGTRRGRGWLLWLPGLLVALGAGAATAHGLFEVAAGAGVPAGLAWLYPLITDGLALVAYVSTIRLTTTDRTYAWCVVVLAAGLSGLAQAAHLAGGVGDVSAALRFGVGAWPAVAAAVVAHLLFLIAHGTSDPDTADGEQAADSVPADVASGVDERPNVQDAQPEPFSTAVQAHVQADVQPSVQPAAVQPAPVQPSSPKPRPVASGPARGRREQARVVARRFAHEYDRLPTVSELQEAADVSRGSAHAALKELREHPAHLHIVNNDHEATQP